ncbi:MAG: SET domain-containing protein-lysine N-methyltransferase [Verrucomicrobia bacterium]|nr:SET domain-containing protein-lysine N-methyltransferase [Verrucomicrobiota bacterium]
MTNSAPPKPEPVFEIRPSPIHGRGAFALRDFTDGTRVTEYVGEKIAKTESSRRCQANNEYIFYLDENFDLDGNVDGNPARFFNHSCTPNCVAILAEGRIWLIAARTISSGEELTFNYGYDLVDYREHPCRCGAYSCVGFMVAEEFFAHAQSAHRRRGGLE